MTYRVRNLVIAVVLAATAALLTSVYVTNYKRHVQQGEAQTAVWVASRDIPAGTSGADAAKALTSKQVASRSVVPGAISEPDQLRNLIASEPVFAGEQVTTRRFSNVAQQGVHGKLKGNLRAVQIQGSAQQLLAGTLRAGDHVDLVASFKYKVTAQQDDSASEDFEATRIILRDIEVLRASGGTAPGSQLATGNQEHAVLLALTDAQENKLQFTLTFADGNDAWTLQLRPPVEASDSPESVETLTSILRDGLSKAQVARLFGKYGG